MPTTPLFPFSIFTMFTIFAMTQQKSTERIESEGPVETTTLDIYKNVKRLQQFTFIFIWFLCITLMISIWYIFTFVCVFVCFGCWRSWWRTWRTRQMKFRQTSYKWSWPNEFAPKEVCQMKYRQIKCFAPKKNFCQKVLSKKKFCQKRKRKGFVKKEKVAATNFVMSI